MLERPPLKGSIYSGTPIDLGRPFWRADLLETAEPNEAHFDRIHYDPTFNDWGPNSRIFDDSLSTDPYQWLSSSLRDIPQLLQGAGISEDELASGDFKVLYATVDEIVETTRTAMERVRAGEVSVAPAKRDEGFVRSEWM
ncbi:hypothetical protein ACSVHC_01500 [Arthrobacter sp. KNU-44]|uniref:hypothetical protein n=1 Tax=Arthrobacter sp. KNU-44 TaxID=3450744 RepID=UPI003F43B2A5